MGEGLAMPVTWQKKSNQSASFSSAACLAGTSVWKTLMAFFLILGLAAEVAGKDDHVVITKKEQTLESVVKEVLKTSQFADHIATYNGFDASGSVLPLGTTVRIPRPYIEVLNFGQIAYVKGDVTLAKANSVVNPPGKGVLVHNGDVIRTGATGFVSVSFNSGAQFNLMPNSAVEVKNVRCLEEGAQCLIELEAKKGSVTSEVKRRPEGQPPVEYSITTPFLSAAVRGTVFYVDVESEVHRVGVTRGLVAGNSAGTEVALPSGTGMAATESSPPARVDLLPMPVYAGGSEQSVYSSEDSFAWESMSGARAYQVKVANDLAITELALSLDVAPGQRDVPSGQSDVTPSQPDVTSTEFSSELLPGDYFVSVSAVDSQSFTGMPLVKSIKFADITDEAQLELSIERRAELVSLELTGDSVGFEGPLQLFISHAIDGNPVQVETLDSLSEPLILNFDQDKTWVFRARKILGPYAVSAYSNLYKLEAR